MTTGSAASVGLSMSVGPSTSVNFFTSSSLIIPSVSASSLLPVVLNITKPFHIGKAVTNGDNLTVKKTLKNIIWIVDVSFFSLDKA